MSEQSKTFRNFNPTGNEHVTAIKTKTDELIDYVQTHGRDPRRVALAITNFEQAAMWAVKSLFSDKPDD